jgi:hypothetical protein
MKTIRLVLVTLLGILTLTSCKGDDEFYNAVYITIPDLISIDTPTNYVVNDDVTFHVSFSRYLPEDQLSTLLDLYKTTQASSFGYAYRLEREITPNVWVSVFNNGDTYSIAEALYDTSTMTYNSDVSINLTVTGNYRLSFGESYTGNQSTDLFSRNPSNQTSVRITTNANNTDSEGYYYFTVN